MVERYLVRYFLAVVEQGGFSRAATRCHVSQPTLSVGIAKLERLIGAALFVRSNQRVELTETGTRFLAHARRIETEFNLAASVGRTATNGIRIGILSSIPGAIVTAAVQRVVARFPQAFGATELFYGNERDISAALTRGRIDAALTLVGRSGERFLEQPLAEEGYRLALPASHPLAARTEIAADELMNDAMIVRRHCEALSDISRHFIDRGVRPHLALRSTDDERILQLIGAGLGLTVMPQSYQAPSVTRPLLAGFHARRVLGLAVPHAAARLIGEPPPVMLALKEALLVVLMAT